MLKKIIILFIVAGTIIMAAIPGVKPSQINKKPFYRLPDIASFYNGDLAVSGNSLVLKMPDGRKIVFNMKKTEMNLFGIVVYLSYPVSKDGAGMPCISQVDYDTLLIPVLKPRKMVPRHQIRRIVVDAGHGGKDHGAERGNVLEKNLNLMVARRVAAILRARGYLVYMTRDTDKQLELKNRSEMTNKIKPDLFISVHFNAHPQCEFHGIEVYTPNPAKVPSFLGALGTAAPCNKFDRENALLGYLMQRRLIAMTGATDRGFKRVQHYVTRNVACPAVLVELGFITNPDECAKCVTPLYMDKMAVGICDAVKDFEVLLKNN